MEVRASRLLVRVSRRVHHERAGASGADQVAALGVAPSGAHTPALKSIWRHDRRPSAAKIDSDRL